jgi:hypothetical protein
MAGSFSVFNVAAPSIYLSVMPHPNQFRGIGDDAGHSGVARPKAIPPLGRRRFRSRISDIRLDVAMIGTFTSWLRSGRPRGA